MLYRHFSPILSFSFFRIRLGDLYVCLCAQMTKIVDGHSFTCQWHFFEKKHMNVLCLKYNVLFFIWYTVCFILCSTSVLSKYLCVWYCVCIFYLFIIIMKSVCFSIFYGMTLNIHRSWKMCFKQFLLTLSFKILYEVQHLYKSSLFLSLLKLNLKGRAL